MKNLEESINEIRWTRWKFGQTEHEDRVRNSKVDKITAQAKMILKTLSKDIVELSNDHLDLQIRGIISGKLNGKSQYVRSN